MIEMERSRFEVLAKASLTTDSGQSRLKVRVEITAPAAILRVALVSC